MVVDGSRPIAEVARELGLVEGTLGNWVGTYRRAHAGDEPALSVSERARAPSHRGFVRFWGAVE